VAPFHPSTVHFPIAFLSFGTLADLVGQWRPEVITTAHVLTLLGVSSAAATVTAGLLDYRGVGDEPTVIRVANTHMLLGLVAWSCYGLSLLARLDGRTLMPPGPLALGFSVIGFGLLIACSHKGGQLVYHYNIGRDRQ
jgi:uncharacterized membrane protein